MLNCCINYTLRCCPNIWTDSISLNKRNYWVVWHYKFIVFNLNFFWHYFPLNFSINLSSTLFGTNLDKSVLYSANSLIMLEFKCRNLSFETIKMVEISG